MNKYLIFLMNEEERESKKINENLNGNSHFNL